MTPLPRRWASIVPCLAGAGAFFLVVGPTVLDPRNVGWLRDASGDSFTHYLGWAFFRNAPWTLPLGANPAYGIEISNSILYSDSIPLLALLLKTMSRWLPGQFQYTGFWLLACFVLQAWFAWLLMGLATPAPAARLAGAVLFVLSPPMLFRLHGHWALVGHWVILAALYLTLRPRRERQAWYWLLLTTVAALVHTYLLAISGALWFAAWAGDLWCRKRRAAVLAPELAAVPAGVLLALWQAGFFLVGNGKEAGGFGGFRMNLNALVNPMGWSRVLPNLPAEPGDYEGFAYLGLGALLAAVVAVHAAIRLRARDGWTVDRAHVPLAIVLAGLTLYALSNRVGLGLHVVEFPLPSWMIVTASLMRASGRLFWPVFYVLLLAIVAAIARAYRPRVSAVLLSVVLAVQVADLSAGWSGYDRRFRKRSAARSPLTSAFWFEAPADYRRLRLVPPGNQQENWGVFADYSQRHGLSTTAVYLARLDRDRALQLEEKTTADLIEGTPERDSMYVLQGSTAWWVACAVDATRDQVSSVDGFWVLMPYWKARHGERYAGQLRLACPVLSAGGEPLATVRGGDSLGTLVSGWSMPETWGTWSEGPRSVLLLRLGRGVTGLEFTASPASRPGPPLEVQVSVAGRAVTTWVVTEPERRAYRVDLPPPVVPSEDGDRVVVRLDYSDTVVPADVSGGHDHRRIALGLYEIRAVR